MANIEFGKHGRILEGFYENYFVQLRNDLDGTGGFLILIVDELSAPTDGGDYWVEDMSALESFIESSKWQIEWGE